MKFISVILIISFSTNHRLITLVIVIVLVNSYYHRGDKITVTTSIFLVII